MPYSSTWEKGSHAYLRYREDPSDWKATIAKQIEEQIQALMRLTLTDRSFWSRHLHDLLQPLHDHGILAEVTKPQERKVCSPSKFLL